MQDVDIMMAGGSVLEPDLEDARVETGVDHHDPLLLELHPPQLLPVHSRVREGWYGVVGGGDDVCDPSREANPRLLQQEDLWLKDSQGFPVLQGPLFQKYQSKNTPN